METVRIPRASENMVEATIGTWHVTEGQEVAREEPLCELITDKAVFDLPSDCAGTIRRIIAEPGAAVPVGYVICLIGDVDEEIPDVTGENARVIAEARAALEVQRVNVRRRSRARATPSARRLAKELKIDLAAVAPADGKVISADDVRAAAGETS